MKDKISILVPVYKVEDYLDNCITSIINQTYDNLEIILVDDGSPDNSPKMCDEWAKKDKRIKVVHKKNGGLSDTRNVGLDNSTGEYICFVDSDDYIEKEYVERLYKSIIDNKVNISQCGINYVDSDNKVLCTKGYDESKIISGTQMLEDYYGEHYIENVVSWNRMYNKKIFKSFRFPVGKLNEDEFTTYKLLFFEKRISIIKDCLYDYRQTDNSIMRSTYKLNKLDVLDALEERLNFFEKQKATSFIENAALQYLYFTREAYYNVKKYYPKEKNIILNLKNRYKDIFEKYKTYSKINKFKNQLFIASPFIFSIFRKIKAVVKK